MQQYRYYHAAPLTYIFGARRTHHVCTSLYPPAVPAAYRVADAVIVNCVVHVSPLYYYQVNQVRQRVTTFDIHIRGG